MNTKFLSTLTFSLLITASCFAGPPPKPSNGSGGKPGCWPPPCVPIDGGISLLIAAGAVYGGRKLYKHKKEENSI